MTRDLAPVRPVLPALALLLSLTAAAPAQAQRSDPLPPDLDDPTVQSDDLISDSPLPAPPSAKRVIADRLARTALTYLRQFDQPTRDDYRLAERFLREARRLAPDDPQLLRMLIHARHAMDDRKGVLDATRDLIRLAPEDTAAQLRLISGRISRLQSAESRLAAYDRLLGSAGERLAPSVRSRLALDDALLSREHGDTERFIDRLSLATQLDSTNKEAASLAATYFLQRRDDPLGRVELLANLILADPFDPSNHYAIVDELLTHGAYEGARRFLNRASELVNLIGRRAPNNRVVDQFIIQWAQDGPESVLDQLRTNEEAQRFQIARLREAAEKAGEDPEKVPDYQPRPLAETVRLAAGSALGWREEVDKAIGRLSNLNDEALRRIRRTQRGGDQSTREQLVGDQTPSENNNPESEAQRRAQRRNEAHLLWMRLWSGAQLDQAAEQINDFNNANEKTGIKPEALQRNLGWLAARRGRISRAQELLEPLAESDPLAELGLAVAAEQSRRNDDAAQRYASVARRQPDTLVGLWARTRHQRLTDQTLAPTQTARRLNDYVAELPREIDDMTTDPWSFMNLSAEHVRERLGPLHRFEVRVRLKNTGPIPLAVGPNAPISSDLLLIPFMTVGAINVHDQLEPEVVSLDHRLRLAPGEAIEATIWADRAKTGALLDLSVLRSTMVRWRLVQRFRVDQEGRFLPGPMSVTAETGVARRPPLRPPASNPQQIQQTLEQASGSALLETFIFLRWLLTSPPEQVPAETVNTLRTESVSRILDRYDSLEPAQRAFLAYIMPAADQVQQFAPLDEALISDTDRVVRLLLLMRRATAPDHPLIDRSLEAEDPVVNEVASILKRRLAEREGLDPGPLQDAPRSNQSSRSAAEGRE